MIALYEKLDQAVYVITYEQERLNQRVAGIVRLGEFFGKMVLVTKTGTVRDERHIVAGAYPNPTGVLRLAGMHRLKKTLDRYLFFPSPDILYVWAAQKKLKGAIIDDLRKGRKVCLLTTVPPHDVALIGLSLKTEFPEIRWLVDWRDLWSWDEYYVERVPSLYRGKLFRLESKILSMCDVNITTNVKAKAVLQNHYRVPSSSVVAISHHFDPPDLPEDSQTLAKHNDSKLDDTIRIGYLGTLFKPPKVPGSRVLDAIVKVRESGLAVKLHVFGDETELARKAARKVRNEAVVFHPRTSHKESLKKLSSCDFFMLALSDLPNCSVIMHKKLPHYLLLRRPILAMVPAESFVAELIQETGSGYVIPTTGNWGEQLGYILRDYSTGSKQPSRNRMAIEKYSWENILKHWIEVIREPHRPEHS